MKSIVAVIKTKPGNVQRDVGEVMELARYRRFLRSDKKTIVKLNFSWDLLYPGSSTSPWVLDGVLNKIKNFNELYVCENSTVVNNAFKNLRAYKLDKVLEKYNLPFTHLNNVDWLYVGDVKTKAIKNEDRFIPSILKDSQLVTIPTLKTHGHTKMTGALKNQFGCLKKLRHHYHVVIDQTLADVQKIIKKYCKSTFCVMDGTIGMEGKGPRAGIPRICNLLMASNDFVALDAIASTIMGINPEGVGSIQIAAKEGLGIADPEDIKIVGDYDQSNLPKFNFKWGKTPVIYFDRLLRSSIFSPLIFKTSLFYLCMLGSIGYHTLWYNLIGKKYRDKILKTGYGKQYR